MSLRSWVASAFLLVGLARLPVAGAETEPRKLGVVDLHVDLSYQVNYRSKPFASGTGQYPAAELRAGGVVGAVLPLYIPKQVSPTGPRAIDLETSYQRMLGEVFRSPSYSRPGCLGSEVRTWFAFEGAAPLADDPAGVMQWAARGLRVYGLVHSYDNALSSSSTEKNPSGEGLTPAGKVFVKKVHEAGGVVDVSHASDRATRDVVELARAAGRPVVATHSNARALADHPRNLTDDLLRAIASTRGLVGVNFHQAFLARGRPATLEDVVNHVRHVVRVAGIEHVAIGSDYEGGIRPPRELPSAASFPVLASALIEDGFSRDEVSRIFSRNALRVLCPAQGRTGE